MAGIGHYTGTTRSFDVDKTLLTHGSESWMGALRSSRARATHTSLQVSSVTTMSVMADSDHPCQETNQLCTPQSIKVVHGVSANAWFGIWRFSHAAKDFTDMAYAFTISRNFMALNASTSLYKLGDTDILYFGRICGVTILWGDRA